MEIRCRHRLPSPELAGFTTLERLREAAARYPHLRPCPKYGWSWLYRTACAKCRDRVEGELEGSELEHEKGPVGKHRAKEDENMRVIYQNVESSMPANGRAIKGKVV